MNPQHSQSLLHEGRQTVFPQHNSLRNLHPAPPTFPLLLKVTLYDPDHLHPLVQVPEQHLAHCQHQVAGCN